MSEPVLSSMGARLQERTAPLAPDDESHGWAHALLCGALFLLWAAPASAARNQESIFEDEHHRLKPGGSEPERAITRGRGTDEDRADFSALVMCSAQKYFTATHIRAYVQ